MARFQKLKKSGVRGAAWVLGAALALGMAITTPQVALAAEDTALLEVTKSASKETLKPGETMEYRIEIGCSSIADLGCRGATLSDLIPAEFEIVPGSVSVANATSNPPVVEGNQVTVEFTDELGDGTVGLLENADAVITIQVKLRDDLPFEANGKPIVNTATVDAENAAEVSDVVSVVPEVELKLGTEVEKSYSPTSAQAEPGAKTQLTVNGTNKSNAGVDTLTLTDPTDPTASPNPFDLLEIATLDSLTFPEGAADTATVEYFIDGEWVPVVLSASDMPHAPPGDAKGVRVTFTAADGSKIPTNAGGGFVLNLEQRADVADLTEKTVVNNTVESEVALEGNTASAGDEADYTILTEALSVKAEKSFSPNELIAGQQTEVTLTGTNTSLVDLDTFSIREPAEGTFAPELDFKEFTSKVQFPTAAASGTLTLVYLDTNGAEQTFGPIDLTDGADFPALPADFGTLQYFQTDFVGPVEPGSSSEITFSAEANEKALNPTESVKNVVGVDGAAGSKTANDTANDTVTFSEKKLEIVTEKKLSPGEIWGYPGEGVLVQLPTTVVKPGSNVPATEIIVSDPALSDPSDPDSAPASSAFWDKFTPQAITNTDVPAGATLTVRYWDTEANAWVTIPGFEGLTGTVNQDLPADILDKIGGLQFVFTNPDPGFEPHEAGEFNVNPSFTATLDEKYEGDEPLELANCATSSGSATTEGDPIEDVTDAPACDDITVNAPIPGEYDLFDKTWHDAGNPAQIVQRSGDHATTRLHWSTENLTFETMTLGETRLGKTPGAGPADAVADTTFEAFNLVMVKAVTEDTPFVKGWDMITAIDLWIGGAWVPATNATGLPYTKTMSDIELTAAEQRDATAVRIVFAENSDGRLGAGADAPAPGTGITKSMGRDRKVDLEWELRDVRRSNPAKAVIASEIFNVAGEEGLVKNWGSATGEQPGGGVEHDQEDDDITIVPRPLGVTVSKGWSGGPLGVPPGDVPASSYPTSRVTIAATNTSQQKVDQLAITDPGAGQANPFEIFSLRKIVSVPNSVPGADPALTSVLLTKSDGDVETLTPAAAIAKTPAQLADVVKIELRHQGRILSDAKATLQLDLQLRKTHRSDPSKLVTVVDSPVKNGTSASVTDLLGLEQEHSVDASDDAQIRLDTFELGVQTTKKFTPDQQMVKWAPGSEQHTAEEWSAIRMDLTARPTGTARPDALIVTDSGENRIPGTPSAKSFWNAYRYIGFTNDTLAVPNPINRVQAEVLYGDFESGLPANALNFASEGDGWVLGSAEPVAVTGGKVENAAATLLANIDAADYDRVRGIRLTYTRVDAAGEKIAFENPANPEVKIALDVKRRAYLVSDPTEAVPDSDAAISAPGEPVQAPGGQFHNTVDADAESFVKLPFEGSDEPLPLVASDEATARVTYLADGVEVAVEKTPLGAQAPGKVIPFTLKTTNTAVREDPGTEAGAETNRERRIPNLVIRDIFPVADGKPQLVFDPDMEESKRFSFALDNPYAEGRFPVTVDPSKITVVYLGADMEPLTGDGEPFGVEFRFPRGSDPLLASDLYPEEVYTVTLNMMFRPGVLAGSNNALTNEFYVASDRPFDGCNFDASQQTQECRADTEVYPTEAGALRGKKYVRANDTELGLADVPNPNSGMPHVPHFGSDTDPAYYSSNSVPITKPLGIETWREELQNTGTLPMDTVVTIDSLPKPDDQGALVLLPRKSEWRPMWEGNVSVVTHTAPDGTEYRTDVTPKAYYSSSEEPVCVADLKPTEPQCADGTWQLLTDAVDPEQVRHVKMVFDFSAEPLKPGQRLAYTFETRTPAQAPKMTADTVAWNSVAVGARTIDSGGEPASVLPTEGLRVGVALATGPLAIEKLVEGEGASFAPDEFEVTVQCTVPQREGSEPAEGVALDPVTVTVTAGEPVTLEEQFPWGAKCEVVEPAGANGETSSTSGDPVTVGRDTDPVPVLQLTNTYDLGAFTVAKEVVGATNQDGEAIDYGAFPVSASCTFLGEEIPLDPATTELTADGTAWLVDQLPVGAKCTLTELDAQGGIGTLEGPGVEQNDDGSWTITVTEGPDAAKFTLTNTMPLGAIEIAKQVTGEGAAAVSDDTSFTFAVVCTFEEQTVWEGTVSLTKAEALAGTVKRIDTLPQGAECGVTETGTGGATASEILNVDGEPITGPVEVGALDAPVTFTAVNTYDAGALHVTKEITGAGAERWGTGPFAVTLECTVDGTAIAVPEGAERALTAEGGFAADYTGLPVGAECELVETTTGGATSAEIVHADGTAVDGPIVVGAGDALALRVINTFDIGEITVEKKITGAGASLASDKVFTVALACTIDRDGTTVALDIPDGATRELSTQGGLTASYQELPVGAACELRETKTGGAKSVTITPNLGDPAVGAVTVASGAAAQLTVVNEFPAVPVDPTDPVDPGTPGKPGPGLATTGGASLTPWLIGGGALLLVGAVLLLLRARRGKGDE